MTDQAAAARVRAFLLDGGYTAEGVLARVGPAAFDTLGRGLTVPLRRALAVPPPAIWRVIGASAPTGLQVTGGPGVDVLIKLFLIGDPVPSAAVPDHVLDDLNALGLVERRGDGIAPLLEVRPYGEPDTDWYLVSDLGAPATPDHVLGAGGASLTLARITPRTPVGRALDLGCGSGVQVLHAARHADQVVATDTNEWAVRITALSAALSGIPMQRLDLRVGSLFDPVADERFDLIVSNPPFVISPGHRFTYRDGGLPGDDLCRTVVRDAAAHLAPAGRAVILANWLHVTGEDWADRVTDWIEARGAHAWIVQRDVEPVADYAATWLRDAGIPEGESFDSAMHEWLDAFEALGAHAVGFGWVVLVAADSERDTWRHVEDLALAPRLPDGDEVAAFLEGCQRVHELPATALLATHARLAEGATVTTTSLRTGHAATAFPSRLGLAGVVGPDGWRAPVPVPPALLAALDDPAAASIGARLDAAAQAKGLDPLDVLGPALMALRELVRLGIVRTV